MSIQSKGQFYHKGYETQKRADVTVDLRRPQVEAIKKWTAEQKRLCLKFLTLQEDIFNAFKEELLEALNTKADQ